MTSLERAKHFLAKKASRLALAVVPIAAVAISTSSAKAGAVLPSNDGCFVVGSSTSGSCSSFQQGAVGGNSQMNWIAMAGSGIMDGSSGGSMTFVVSGSAATGSITSGSIPVAWDFSLTDVDGVNPSVTWTVTFTALILTPTFETETFTLNGTAPTGGAPITGSGSFMVPGGTVDGYVIELQTSSSGEFGVSIPGESTLDFNVGSTASSVPEPATLLLAPSAGVLLFLRRKRRKPAFQPRSRELKKRKNGKNGSA